MKSLRDYLDRELLLEQLSVLSSHWTASLNLMPFKSLHSPQASQPAWLQVHNHVSFDFLAVNLKTFES